MPARSATSAWCRCCHRCYRTSHPSRWCCHRRWCFRIPSRWCCHPRWYFQFPSRWCCHRHCCRTRTCCPSRNLWCCHHLCYCRNQSRCCCRFQILMCSRLRRRPSFHHQTGLCTRLPSDRQVPRGRETNEASDLLGDKRKRRLVAKKNLKVNLGLFARQSRTRNFIFRTSTCPSPQRRQSPSEGRRRLLHRNNRQNWSDDARHQLVASDS